MLRLIGVWLLVPGLLLGGAATAIAQDAAQERAKQFFTQGSKDFAEGRFARALDAFEQANAIKPHPVMLKNIAKTYEAMKDLTLAVSYYKKYVATNPGDAGDIKKKIAGIEATMARWSRLTLNTDPPGAAVWIDSRDQRSRGKTPVTLVVEPGPRKIILSLGGHDVVEKALTLTPGQALTLPTIALKQQQPQLMISTTPAGAEVFIDGAATAAGRTPLTVKLPAGAHEIQARLAGHKPLKQSVTLTAQHITTPLRTALRLEAGKPPGMLVIELEAGEVFIDGKSVGTAPLSAPIELEEGLHPIEVRGAGSPYSEMVAITSGETTTTTIDIDGGGGGSGISQSTVGWILMGTGGAVVLGGVITSILALSADGELQDCRDDPACAFTNREVTLADDVRASALTTDILLGVGAAIAATGVVLYVLADDEPTRTPTAGVPQVGITPILGGAAAVGRFEF